MKKLSLIFAAMAMMLIFVFSANAEVQGDFTYEVADNWATITDVSESISGEVIVPPSLGGYPVTKIGSSAFSDCRSIQSITIPDSVTDIGSNAFKNCQNLTSITIGNNLSKIESYAFYGCNLQSVYIKDLKKWFSVEIAGYHASPFWCGADLYLDGNKVTELTIPDGMTEIGSQLSGCTSVVSVHIPESVTAIGKSAFTRFINLRDITIPDSVTSIGSYGFSVCNSLQSITIPGSVTSMGGYAFAYCKSLTSVIISDGLTSISDLAFHDCESLTSIVIPETITAIESGAFCRCFKLSDIFFAGTKEQWESMRIEYRCNHDDCACNNKPLENAKVHYNYSEQHFTAVVTEPDCMNEGYTTYSCPCGEAYKDNYTQKSEHKYSDAYTVDKEATYTAEGSKSRHCTTDCCTAKTDVTVIPKLVVTFTESEYTKVRGRDVFVNSGLTAAKLLLQTDEGAEIKTADGKAVVGNVLIGTGMLLSLADGSKKELVVPGDVDGDGKVTASDARLALRASVGLEKYSEDSCCYKAADVDGEDNMSASDARLILRASVGLEKPEVWLK